MPSVPVFFKLRISEICQYSKKNDFWLLFHFGRLVVNLNDRIIKREIHLVNIKDNNYCYTNEWNREKVISIEIREEKTFQYCLGTIFDCTGYPVNHPELGRPIFKKKIVLSNNYNLKKEGLKDILSNSYFPLNKIEQKIDNNSSYFYFFNKKVNKDKVYIPNCLISKYFYYYSISTVHSLIYNRLEKGILESKIINNRNTVFYDGNLISSNDIQAIARYFYTSGLETGIDILKEAIRNFNKSLLNNEKSKLPLISDINYNLPFNSPLEVLLIGQYIQQDKFIAYDIINVAPFHRNEKFFTVDDFELFNINDKRSSDNKEEKESKKGTNIKGQKFDESLKNINDYESTNSTIPQENFTLPSRNFFSDSPKSKILDRNDQNHRYICDKLVIKDYDGYGIEYDNTSSDSTIRKANMSIFNETSHYQILHEALDILSKEFNFQFSYLTINYSTYFPFSIAPFCHEENKSFKIVDMILIVNVFYNDKLFCLVDAGPGFRIGIFEYFNIPFKERNDPNLTMFINYMVSSHHFKWSSVYCDFNIKKNNELKKEKYITIQQRFGYNILQPLEHIDINKKENIIENLAMRIKVRIEKNQ